MKALSPASLSQPEVSPEEALHQLVSAVSVAQRAVSLACLFHLVLLCPLVLLASSADIRGRLGLVLMFLMRARRMSRSWEYSTCSRSFLLVRAYMLFEIGV